ncbi:hypothetical protein AABB24_039346, partial [Solanum stoloniferum]
ISSSVGPTSLPQTKNPNKEKTPIDLHFYISHSSNFGALMESSSSIPASRELNEVQTDLPSSVRSVSRTGAPNNMVMGKHRLAAAISALNQQINIIQEELDQLDSFGEASLVCRELVSSVELIPDALLPVTRGPINVHLDRWFHGGNDSRRNKRWI